MLDVLCPLINESDVVSNDLLDIILMNVVEPAKSQRRNAYQIAKELIVKCSDTLEPYIQAVSGWEGVGKGGSEVGRPGKERECVGKSWKGKGGNGLGRAGKEDEVGGISGGKVELGLAGRERMGRKEGV